MQPKVPFLNRSRDLYTAERILITETGVIIEMIIDCLRRLKNTAVIGVLK